MQKSKNEMSIVVLQVNMKKVIVVECNSLLVNWKTHQCGAVLPVQKGDATLISHS